MKKRKRNVPIYVYVSKAEHEQIQARMAEAGISNMSAFVRKIVLTGHILHVDLSPVKELVSLQRRCANNINQVAIHANTYGVYQSEITALQKGYNELWSRVSDVLNQLAAVVEL